MPPDEERRDRVSAGAIGETRPVRAFWYLAAVVVAAVYAGVCVVSASEGLTEPAPPAAAAVALFAEAPRLPGTTLAESHPALPPLPPTAVDVAALYRTAIDPSDAVDYLTIHLPRGAVVIARSESGAATSPRSSVAFAMPVTATGSSAVIAYSFSLDGSTTLYRIDATASVRPVAERVPAGSSATVTAGARTRMLAPAAATALVAAYNALVPVDAAVEGACPSVTGPVVVFDRADGSGRLTAATACGVLAISARGAVLPSLMGGSTWVGAVDRALASGD